MQSGLELGVYIDATAETADGLQATLNEGLAAVDPCSLSVNHSVPPRGVLRLAQRPGCVPGLDDANSWALWLTPRGAVLRRRSLSGVGT